MTIDTEANESTFDRRIHLALRNWYDHTGSEGLLADLLIHDKEVISGQTSPRQCTNAVLRRALQQLAQEQPMDAALLEARYIERKQVDQVAFELQFADSTIYVKQKTAFVRLAAIVQALEDDAWRERNRRLDAYFPALPATPPVGHATQLDHLIELLTGGDSPWLLSIEGIGGIGKTTLAVALARQIARTRCFADFAWVSAKPAILDLGGAIRATPRPAMTAQTLVAELLAQLAPEAAQGLLAFPERALKSLRNRLRDAPHLIFVDNLETIADLETLAPTLFTLIKPSKFVMTSRRRLIDERSIYLYPVPELSECDSLKLVRREAEARNLPEVANADDADLRAIYATVGGNPLALLLVVGLTHIHSLSVVLRNLREARGLPAANLYTFVYRQAWEALDEVHRQVLLAMPLASMRGESLDFIASICDLPTATTADALHRLNQLSLVNVSGDLHRRCYAIHSLTRTFLQEQVAGWL